MAFGAFGAVLRSIEELGTFEVVAYDEEEGEVESPDHVPMIPLLLLLLSLLSLSCCCCNGY